MLIKRKPDTFEKLHILGGMATDDILSDSHARRRGPYSSRKKNPIPGVYRASMPNGKHINLFRVMFTDFCKMDCHFCPNSHWVPRKRHAFKIDELAKAFMELHQRHAVDGLFLSSGVAGTGSKTTERLVRGRRNHPQEVRLQRLRTPQSHARHRLPIRRSRPRPSALASPSTWKPPPSTTCGSSVR